MKEAILLRDKRHPKRTKDKLWPRLQRKVNPLQEIGKFRLKRVEILQVQVSYRCLQVYDHIITSQGKKYVELVPEDVDQGPGLFK